MKVVFIAPHDTSGGAVRIARYLFDGLLDREFESFFISGKKTTNHPNIYELDHGDSLLKKIILKSIKKINYKIGLENFYYPKTKDLLNLIDVKPDIIHIHNPQGGYFDLRQLEYLSNSFPTIIELICWLVTDFLPTNTVLPISEPIQETETEPFGSNEELTFFSPFSDKNRSV